MEFDNNLAAIHGYLCGDGYVIKNPETQKHKYYHVGFRNTDHILLEDFQKRFLKYFKTKPIIEKNQRCKKGSRMIYEILTLDYSYYSYEWMLPELTRNQLKLWLRAFFDCEAWVVCEKRKSRLVGVESVNKRGLQKVKRALFKYGINTKKLKKRKSRNTWRLSIFGLKNLKKYRAKVGFLHPKKKKALDNVIDSYVNYRWIIPLTKKEFFNFIKSKGKYSDSRKETRFYSILKNNLTSLKKALSKFNIKSKVLGPLENKHSKYYCLVLKDSKAYKSIL